MCVITNGGNSCVEYGPKKVCCVCRWFPYRNIAQIVEFFLLLYPQRRADLRCASYVGWPFWRFVV